jgi:hypothetical protein
MTQCVIVRTKNGIDTAYPIQLDEAQKLVKNGTARLDSGVIYIEVIKARKKPGPQKGYKTKVQKPE